MKKVTKSKGPKKPVKKDNKKSDSGELRKPSKLKPMKEKEKKSWKKDLNEEEEEFEVMPDEGDMKLEDFNANDTDDDDDQEEFFDDSF